jgi:hypothetical protein
MTPADEATFIQLWQQGLTHEAMAQQLAWPLGTVKSRLHTLIQQGKIQPRRVQRTPARQESTPHPRPTRRHPHQRHPRPPATRPRSPSWPSPKCEN